MGGNQPLKDGTRTHRDPSTGTHPLTPQHTHTPCRGASAGAPRAGGSQQEEAEPAPAPPGSFPPPCSAQQLPPDAEVAVGFATPCGDSGWGGKDRGPKAGGDSAGLPSEVQGSVWGCRGTVAKAPRNPGHGEKQWV